MLIAHKIPCLIKSGSFGGKQLVSISGQGFSSKSVVMINGNVCDVTKVTSKVIKCFTPAQDGDDSIR